MGMYEEVIGCLLWLQAHIGQTRLVQYRTLTSHSDVYDINVLNEKVVNS